LGVRDIFSIHGGVAVLKLKEKAREDQRAIKEQIREEQRAKREIERAIQQAVREEALVNKAIAKLRKQFEDASEAERARLEDELESLSIKLAETEATSEYDSPRGSISLDSSPSGEA
jgi:hypothetical protein